MTVKAGGRGLNIFKDTTVTSVVIGAAATFFSLLIAVGIRAVGYRLTLVGLGFSLCVIAVDVWILARIVGGRIAERLEMTDEHFVARLTEAESRLVERFNHTDGFLQTLQGVTGTAFLKTQAEVMAYERDNVQKEVWIVSQRLDDEFKAEIREVIVFNLERGVRYIYIIPKDSVVVERVRQIKQACGNHAGVVWFHMPGDFFDLVPRHDISIYDPLGKTSDQIVAYMNLPARSAPNNLFVILEGDYAIGILNKLIPPARRARIIN